jgi:hypothetical protein
MFLSSQKTIDFLNQKTDLLNELEEYINRYPDNDYIKSVHHVLNKTKSPRGLTGQLTKIAIDGIDYDLEIGTKVMDFEAYHMERNL